MDMITRPRYWIDVLSSLRDFEYLVGDLPSHKWLGYFRGCGCGTAVHAAQKLNRQWIDIDITHLAISLIEKRLKDAFKTGLAFEIHGTPKDLDAARDLATRDKYQFNGGPCRSWKPSRSKTRKRARTAALTA